MKELIGQETIHDSIGYHYAWVSTDEFLNAKTLKDAMAAWRYDIEEDDLGNVIGIEFTGEKLGDELIMFKAIAPYVQDGSYLEMQGEDGESWRWLFRFNDVKEISPKVSWDENEE